MPTHIIRDADGEPVGTITATDTTYLIEVDGAPAIDPWQPGFDPAPWIAEIGTRGFTIEKA